MQKLQAPPEVAMRRKRHQLLWKDKKQQNAERIKKNQGKPNSMHII